MPHHDPRQASQRLLDWNRRHLTAHSELDEAAINSEAANTIA